MSQKDSSPTLSIQGENQTFSWLMAEQRTLNQTIRCHKNRTKNGNHLETNIKHPDWCRDGKKGLYTVMIKQLTTQHNDRVQAELNRRSKIYGK